MTDINIYRASLNHNFILKKESFMHKHINQYALLAAVLLIFSIKATDDASNDFIQNSSDCSHNITKKKCCRRDPLIGIYTLQVLDDVTVPDSFAWGNISFNADGSLTGLDTGGLGQGSLESAFLASPWTGQWKRISKRTYKLFLVSTLTQIQDTPPYPPAGRFSLTADITLSDDHLMFTMTNARASFYDLSDPTLSNPTVIAIGKATGYRISFDTFN